MCWFYCFQLTPPTGGPHNHCGYFFPVRRIPAFLNCKIHVLLTLLLILYFAQHAVMGPAQFLTHCVKNWKCHVKPAHIGQVGVIKAFPKLNHKIAGKIFQHLFPIGSPRGTFLLIFNNQTTNIPVQLDKLRIYLLIHSFLRIQYKFTYGIKQSGRL